MLNCVVLDDELLARDILAEYLSRLDFVASVQLVGNAREGATYLESHPVDVLFLDIEMPGLNGLDLLTSLSNPPITVFTTAYRNYAFEGFELGVIDFLLKPIAFPRFLQAIEKVRDFLVLKDQNANLETGLSETLPGSIQTESFFIKSGVQRIKLHLDEVTYIQGLKDYAIIHTLSGRIVVKGSLKAMQRMFPPGQFVRVHKSFMVATARITRLERSRLVVNGNLIPIGRSYRDDLEGALLRHRQ